VSVHPTQQVLDSFDELGHKQRQEVLQHARTCAGCREQLVSVEPGRLFALLGTETPSEHALARLSARIQTEIDTGPERSRSSRGWLTVAAIAASLLVVILIGLQSSRQTPFTGTSEPNFSEVTPVTSDSFPGLDHAVTEQTDPPRSVELISSPGDAQLVDFAIGDIQVVMIFDQELDI
jgi:hypothetical protein